LLIVRAGAADVPKKRAEDSSPASCRFSAEAERYDTWPFVRQGLDDSFQPSLASSKKKKRIGMDPKDDIPFVEG
jgi:hypothetical protein